jgi:predicted kinase
MNELAFPYMDLIHHRRNDLANRLLSEYLEQTGDYIGLGVFRFYLVYRAMVRAKVDWFRQQQTSGSLVDSTNAIFQTPYLDLARELSKRPDCVLYITHGLSGSGKSTAARKFVETKGAIRLRSDIERDRVIKKYPDVEKYSAEMRSKVYDAMSETAENVLAAGFSVVVDATFLNRIEREKFGQLAKRAGSRFGIIECSASVIELERRIRERRADASEATVAVLHEQILKQEDLTQEELGYICNQDDFRQCNTK